MSTTSEPRYFVYENNQLQRPDLVVNLSKPVVTDFTIVNSEFEVGIAGERAAKEKVKIHRTAVNKAGATFIPFVLETHGNIDSSCLDWCNAVGAELHPVVRRRFTSEILYNAQVALAKGRAKALLAICHESLGFEFGLQDN